MTIEIEQPNPKQLLFLKATAKHVAFGGARGGGKSWAVRTKAKLLAAKYPGIKILIVRKTYAELRNNHVEFLRPELKGLARYNKAENVFYFVNGSQIKFGYCSCDGDLDQYQGTEVDVVFLDEATQLTEHMMKIITACCRGVNDYPKRIYYTCNPGGVGHQYIKRLFIDRHFNDKERPEDYVFIQSLVTDNTALMKMDEEYIAQLEALPPKIREAWLYGRWDVYEGQFFEEFRDDPDHYKDRIRTHVIEPFDIPEGWTIVRSFDWGYARPFSCAWWAIDYDGVAYRILELYGCTQQPNEGVKWTPDQVFGEIHRIETEHRWLKGRHITGVADPAIWDAQTGESLAERASKYMVYFGKGDHARIPGWMQVHYRMAFDENGYAMMYFFKNCKAAIRTLPLLMFSETKPEDLDTTQEDHAADDIRYFCMSRPIKPRKAQPPDEFNRSPLHEVLELNKDDVMPRRHKPKMEIIDGN